MRCNCLEAYTDVIPIYDSKGSRIDEIVLKEKIKPVPRRRCGFSNRGVYYKGAGIVYTGHFVNEYEKPLKLVASTGAVYEKYNVINTTLFRKFGIFTFRHQPCFSDYEGGCGIKEKNILGMQKRFAYSAIDEILSVIDTPLEGHYIYEYRLKELSGNYKDTLRLIEYILCENFNTAWDKNLWDDIECFGYVRDLADWFISDAFCHKLGTIYALLSNVIKKDKYLYEMIVRTLTGLEQLGDHHIIYIAALIVKKYTPACVGDIDMDNPCESLYTYLWKQLYAGKACCHLENEDNWSGVREVFNAKIQGNVAMAMNDLLYWKIAVNRM